MIAERSAEQQQRRKRQQISVDDPLHFLGAGAVAGADRGQRDAEHRAFDERQARGEDAGDQSPARVGARLSPALELRGLNRPVRAIAASTMLRHTSASPAAAIASSGSRNVCSTASAWFTCSRQARSIFSAGGWIASFRIAAERGAGEDPGDTFDGGLFGNGHDLLLAVLPRSTRLRPFGFKQALQNAPCGQNQPQ